MLVQILLRGQTAFAYLALVGRLVVSVLHMRLEGRHVFTRVSADATDDGRFAAMHLIRMLLQIVLDLELLLANRAGVVIAAGVLPREVILQGALVVALVLANAAGIEQRSVNLLDVALQVSLQAETLATGLALVPVLPYVFYHAGFVAETFVTRGAYQEELGFPLVDFVLTVVLLLRIFPRAMILLSRHLSFSSNVSFEPIR